MKGGRKEARPAAQRGYAPKAERSPALDLKSAVRRHLQQGEIDRRLLDRRTPAGSRRDDEAPLGVEDSRGREGWRRRRCRPTTRRPAATPPVPRRCQPVRRGQRTGDRGPHRPAGLPASRHVQRAGRWCRCASARTCHICQVDRLCSMTAKVWAAVWETQRASTILWPQRTVPTPSAPSTSRRHVRPALSRPRQATSRVAQPGTGVRA